MYVFPTKSERRDGKFFAMRKNQGMDAEKGLGPSAFGKLVKISDPGNNKWHIKKWQKGSAVCKQSWFVRTAWVREIKGWPNIGNLGKLASKLSFFHFFRFFWHNCNALLYVLGIKNHVLKHASHLGNSLYFDSRCLLTHSLILSAPHMEAKNGHTCIIWSPKLSFRSKEEKPSIPIDIYFLSLVEEVREIRGYLLPLTLTTSFPIYLGVWISFLSSSYLPPSLPPSFAPSHSHSLPPSPLAPEQAKKRNKNIDKRKRGKL